MTARSYLYVPGDQADKLARAGERGADALIADLEDAVAPAARPRARETVAEWLAGAAGAAGPERWVRVNSGLQLAGDVEAVLAPALAGVWLPKCGSAADLLDLDALLSAAEAAAGVSRRTPVVALVESAAGVLSLPDIARGERVAHVGLGEVDLASDVGVEPGPAGEELGWARALLVVASSAAGLDSPIGPVSADFRDLESLRQSSVALRRQGYWGRAAIHPAQVAVINEVFTVSEDDIAAAAAVVDLYEAALAAGEGVAIDAQGRMVDEAVVKVARRVLSRAARSPQRRAG